MKKSVVRFMSEKIAYWRNDKKDNFVHFYTECPEIQAAKSIGRGSIEDAIKSGHGVACQKCKQIKYQKELQEKSHKKYEEFVKEQNKKDERLKIGIYCFMTAIFAFMFCFFAMFVPQTGKEEEAYNSGYQDGYNDAKDISYSKGYKDGKESSSSDAYNNGYNKGYDKGYADGKEDSESASNTSGSTYSYSTGISDPGYSQIVYITETGSKYHNWGCQYLSQSCIKVSIEYALDQGLTACSKCW